MLLSSCRNCRCEEYSNKVRFIPFGKHPVLRKLARPWVFLCNEHFCKELIELVIFSSRGKTPSVLLSNHYKNKHYIFFFAVGIISRTIFLFQLSHKAHCFFASCMSATNYTLCSHVLNPPKEVLSLQLSWSVIPLL